MKYSEAQDRALAEHNNWLEDVLAGLLINGIAKENISIRYQKTPRGSAITIACVNGVPKYSWDLWYTIAPSSPSPTSPLGKDPKGDS